MSSREYLPEESDRQEGGNRLLSLLAKGHWKGQRWLSSNSRGQSLVIVAIMLILLIGMLALSIDGGNWYWNRRKAQNAADAGALAGAREYCTTNDANLALTRAREYTITRNQADAANIVINSGMVTVTANIQFNNFFAGVLGFPQGNVSATAAAGCFSPGSGTGILPIAWNCKPEFDGVPMPSISHDCTFRYGTPDTPGPLYLIMDSEDYGSDFYCQDPTTHEPAWALDCDLNDDGYNDGNLAGGGRSWLDLNGGGGGAVELSNWILGGYTPGINIHTWVSEQRGTANSIYQAAHERVGDIVLLPVFDNFCSGLPSSNCSGDVHAQDIIIPGGGSGFTYFHLITFAAFKITCVDAPPYGPCPGHDAAVNIVPGFKANTKTIEGYFVEGFIPGLGGRPSDGVDAGVYTLYLTR